MDLVKLQKMNWETGPHAGESVFTPQQIAIIYKEWNASTGGEVVEGQRIPESQFKNGQVVAYKSAGDTFFFKIVRQEFRYYKVGSGGSEKSVWFVSVSDGRTFSESELRPLTAIECDRQ
jgi:hypothetical protein